MEEIAFGGRKGGGRAEGRKRDCNKCCEDHLKSICERGWLGLGASFHVPRLVEEGDEREESLREREKEARRMVVEVVPARYPFYTHCPLHCLT